jgi:hypothetical protein
MPTSWTGIGNDGFAQRGRQPATLASCAFGRAPSRFGRSMVDLTFRLCVAIGSADCWPHRRARVILPWCADNGFCWRPASSQKRKTTEGPAMGIDWGIRNTVATSHGGLYSGIARQKLKGRRQKIRASLPWRNNRRAREVLRRLSGGEHSIAAGGVAPGAKHRIRKPARMTARCRIVSHIAKSRRL